jgi:hypothetical protein
MLSFALGVTLIIDAQISTIQADEKIKGRKINSEYVKRNAEDRDIIP